MIQFISHYTDRYSYLDGIRLALEGGCKWIQLRMKNATDDEVRPIAKEAQQLCREAGATFVIDDRVLLVKELHADGVHLGKGDMPISEARRILGDTYIIGGTANTIDDVRRHYHDGANYIGCGPFRFTTTKERLSPILGLEGYCNIIRSMREEGIDIPLVAIGGIALSGTILRAEQPVEEMKRITALTRTAPL